MSDDNPYASPLTTGAAVESAFGATAQEMVPAGRGRRFLNHVIDSIVGTVFAGMSGVVIGLASLAVGHPEWVEDMSPIADFLLSTSLLALYYFTLEAAFGRTVGKLLTGTVVVNAQGGRAKVGQALGRTFARWIRFEAFSALGGPPHPWHDRLSKTRVVRLGRD